VTDTNRRLIDALRAFVPEVMRVNATPGLNLALGRQGRLLWEEGFGFADLEDRTPMTPRTTMHSGSMGKTYTATAVMQLVEKGVMGLHDPINRHLHGFEVDNPLGERDVTVYDLLTHRSGLASNEAAPDFAPPPPLGEHLERSYGEQVQDLYYGSVVPKWTAKVGMLYQYSNTGMATLGFLVEATNPDGLSFSDYVQRHIIEPLGMHDTQYPPYQDVPAARADLVERFSSGYAGFAGLNLPTPPVYFADHPAGTVVTTPGDHLRLLLAYLNGGELDGQRILRDETVGHMLTPQVTGIRPTDDAVAGGLAWFLGRHGKVDGWFGHVGAHMYGWHNDFRAYPELDVAVVVATNRWDMVAWSLGLRDVHDSAFIADFVAGFLVREREGTHPGPADLPWAWKRSYAIGLFYADRIMALSPTSALTDAMIAQMAKPFGDVADGFEADAFTEAVEGIRSTDGRVDSIQTFVRSPACRLAPEELALVYRELGGLGPFPVPATVGFLLAAN